MAAEIATAETMIEKNSEILVKVEEAQADLIVVSYCADNKKYQGILLDLNKRDLPFGVYSLHPAFKKDSETVDYNEKLHSVSQRFTYQEPQYVSENHAKKPGPKRKTQPRQKMTVRLRPRKVLCSNCQGICSENSENVAKKRRHEDDNKHDMEKKFLMGSMLIPKLSRLHPNEISSAIKGRGKQKNQSDDEVLHSEMAFVNVDEHVHNDTKEPQFSNLFTNAKTLKICFGEGEGTVVKIPPNIGEFNDDSGVCDMSKQTKQQDTKAAKKAMKRAKKEARKNEGSVTQNETSPKHIGALSPRNNVSDGLTNIEEKKHKHKVKHKKKHKLNKKRDENGSKTTEDETVDNGNDKCERLIYQESGSENESDTVPDFPVAGTEGAVTLALQVSPGDVVWGKVVGFPWWPGRVLSVTSGAKAHVAWYASSTSSLMPCDSLCPFLEDYKIRFNKKKRGAYKEAVKQAMLEAKQNESQPEDPLGSPTLPAMSPRPINVFS